MNAAVVIVALIIGLSAVAAAAGSGRARDGEILLGIAAGLYLAASGLLLYSPARSTPARPGSPERLIPAARRVPPTAVDPGRRPAERGR